MIRPSILFLIPLFVLSTNLGSLRADNAAPITSSADTFVLASQPNSNFGGAGALQVVSSANAKGEYQSLLRFDLASTVAGFNTTYGVGRWNITSATLSLGTNFGTAGTQPNNAIFAAIATGNFNVTWQVNDSWLEGTGNPGAPTTDGLTFNTLSNFTSAANDRTLGTFAFTAPGNNTVSTYGLGLDPSFLGDLTAGNPVSMRLFAADNQVSYLFNSRTFGTAAQRPMLLLTVVPEPSTWALLMAGGVGLLGAIRRKRQG